MNSILRGEAIGKLNHYHWARTKTFHLKTLTQIIIQVSEHTKAYVDFTT